MSSQEELVLRFGRLAQQAALLRDRAMQVALEEDDDTLWMSSLDVIDELLSEITEQIPPPSLKRQPGALGIATRCPDCLAAVMLSPEAAAAPAAICPSCGQSILLANPS